MSLAKIEALAPDQGSVDAARKLRKSALWPKLACDGIGLVWGECQGSGATPYRVVVSETDAGYKCTCPSRKFPCKHSLALMWMRTDARFSFLPAEAPEWVKDWVSRRRAPAAATSDSGEAKKPKVSLSASVTDAERVDPKAEARAAAARDRNLQDREASIRTGLDELDLWLEDQVGRGMAAFVAQSSAACRVIAQRLIDAKAPGLASRLESLSARLFSLPEPTRPYAALEELGQLHLLAEAYRRQERLSPALRADVRQTVGWAVAREALLTDPAAERHSGKWRVVAVQSEVQPDRLRRIETWLMLEGSARFALLLDFVPVTGAAASGYLVGEQVDASLVFYPSAWPLRALVASSNGSEVCSNPLEIPAQSLNASYSTYLRMLSSLPWAARCPLPFRSARIRRSSDSMFLCDAVKASEALRVPPTQAELVRPLAALQQIDCIGIWDGRHLTLCWAETALGRWVSA